MEVQHTSWVVVQQVQNGVGSQIRGRWQEQKAGNLIVVVGVAAAGAAWGRG